MHTFHCFRLLSSLCRSFSSPKNRAFAKRWQTGHVRVGGCEAVQVGFQVVVVFDQCFRAEKPAHLLMIFGDQILSTFICTILFNDSNLAEWLITHCWYDKLRTYNNYCFTKTLKSSPSVTGTLKRLYMSFQESLAIDLFCHLGMKMCCKAEKTTFCCLLGSVIVSVNLADQIPQLLP